MKQLYIYCNVTQKAKCGRCHIKIKFMIIVINSVYYRPITPDRVLKLIIPSYCGGSSVATSIELHDFYSSLKT